MTDPRENRQPVSWLEGELSRQLCPVPAPDSLWRQIHEQRRPLRVRSYRFGWSVAGAALLLVFACLVWKFDASRNQPADLEVLAARELRGLAEGSEKVDIRSNDPREIRRWIRAKLDIDVRMPDRPAPGGGAIRLIGARLIQLEKFSVAAITYRVGDDYAAMLVTDRRGNSTRKNAGHASLQAKSIGGMALSSWSAGGADYTVAFSDAKEPRRACLLCHAATPALVIFR